MHIYIFAYIQVSTAMAAVKLIWFDCESWQ